MPYAFNEGTNSAGEPAAGAPTGADEAPVEAPAKRRGRPRKAAPTARGRGASARRPASGTKQAQLIAMLRRKEGATIAQIVAATGWQPHTVRGAFAGALKKKLGLTVTSEKVEGERAGLPDRLTQPAGDRRSQGRRFSRGATLCGSIVAGIERGANATEDQKAVVTGEAGLAGLVEALGGGE